MLHDFTHFKRRPLATDNDCMFFKKHIYYKNRDFFILLCFHILDEHMEDDSRTRFRDSGLGRTIKIQSLKNRSNF